MKDFLNQHLELDAEGTIVALKNDIDQFVNQAEQFDDITMLELIYKNRDDEEYIEACQEFMAAENELPNVQEFVQGVLKQNDIDEKVNRQIELVVEEIFINIATYAYPKEKGNCALTVRIDKRGKVILIFEDHGIKFNPLDRQDPDVSLSADEREIGGLGIYITKKTMDALDYRYENEKNILVITKNV